MQFSWKSVYEEGKKTSDRSSVATHLDNADAVDNVADADDTILQSVTPTCCEKKLYNLDSLPTSDSND